MEKRNTKIMFAKNGQGSRTTRITLPVGWVDKLGATEENREVFIYEISGDIIITKEELKMEENKALEIIIKGIEREIKEGFICDSDNTDRFLDRTVKEVIRMLSTEDEEEDNVDEYFYSLEEKAKEFLSNSYKSVYEVKNGDYIGYYFDNCFNFKTVEELENHFLIGE